MNYNNTATYPSGFRLQETWRGQAAKDLVPRRTEEGLQKVKTFSFIQLCLAAALTACGIATLVVASENIGFPVFNFGPLLTGILAFVAGGLGFYAARQGLEQIRYGQIEPSISCMVRGNFGVSVALISISVLSGVFAFLSGAVCAGSGIQFYSGRGGNRVPIDVEQYCYPNKTANTALAFVDGALCVILMIWIILGICLYCSYGPLFGIRRRHM